MRLRNILILLAILLALGGYFYFSNIPQPPPEVKPQLFAWLIEDTRDLQHIEIRLPREDKGEVFVKIEEGDKFPWYFDDPQRSKVDVKRWGGGIPLLLSGPGIKRIIAKNATEEKLTEFGLTQPRMEITLILEDREINITIGNKTPDGSAFYIQVPPSTTISLVDYTWYEVLERLVEEPPYASLSTD